MKNTVNDTRTEQTSKSGQTNAGQTIIDDDAVYKNNIHIHITWYYDPPTVCQRRVKTVECLYR